MKNLGSENAVLYVVEGMPEELDLKTDVCCSKCVVEKYGNEKISQWFVIDDQILIIPESAGVNVEFIDAEDYYNDDDEYFDDDF